MSFGVTTAHTVTTVLPGGGFYPDLPLTEFLELYRLPAEYAEKLLADHLALAQIWAAKELESWRNELMAEGVTSIIDRDLYGIPGGAERLYKRAVYAQAKGLLLQQLITIERREAARNEAKDAPESAEGFFATARDAIATLSGRTFIGVGAI